MPYKHTQISYLMIIITLIILGIFSRAYITSAAEAPAVDSGNNLLMTALMVLILATISSFISLQVYVDQNHIRLKFGYGMIKKTFMLNKIASVKTVKNRRYYGRGIKLRLWPKMRIYNVAGFDAVELKMKNGKIYRIGIDEPKKLEQAILHSIQ